MNNLDDAVNQALNDLELVENECFISLMGALYEGIEDLSGGFRVSGEIEQVYDAIGYFVPTGDKQ